MRPLQKKLLFQSHHMGTKENDLIFGSFAETYLDQFTDQELEDYQTLLFENDVQLSKWVMDLEPFPETYNPHVINKLRAHYCSLKKTA